jgi:hypothetical protein
VLQNARFHNERHGIRNKRSFLDFQIDLHLNLNLSGVSLLLEKVQKNRKSTGLFSKVGDNSTRSSNGLLHTTIVVKLGKTAPSTKVLTSFDHDNMNFTFGAKSLDELLVLIVLAILGQAAQSRRSAIQCFGTFVKTLLKSTVDHGLSKNLRGGK